MSNPKKRSSGRPLYWILGILVIAGALIALGIFGPNTGTMKNGEYVYIKTGSTYEDVLHTLDTGGYILTPFSFDMLAKRSHYPAHIHPGKYRITKGMSNYAIVRLLHSGKQTPVKLVVNKLRTKQDFVNLVSKNLEANPDSLRHLLSDSAYLAQFTLDTNTAMCAIMQDTYDFFWNTTADKVFRKIEKNYAHFWTDAKVEQAKQKSLTPQQVITVASIIEEETNANDEKGNIASVYLNRLHDGMHLGADPTVKFAIGDFTLRRITGDHLKVVSPYNTYINYGLPPGPICTPSLSSINAVLEAPQTKYLFFCANPNGSGHHLFAETEEEHFKNARAYHEALDKKGVH